ncbi:MAG: DUF2341 domain-containing protein, partial [Nitrospiraceae bacterium]|nr:DUF2341 domain-containing protein [Nitrospiraceae bacterium]
TNNFTVTDKNWIYYDLPTDWAENTVNTVTAYWIKAEVTSVGSSPSSPVADKGFCGKYTGNNGNYGTHPSDGHVLMYNGAYYLYIADDNYPDTPKTGEILKYKLANDTSDPLGYVGVVKDFTSDTCPGYVSGVDRYSVGGTEYWWVTFDVDDASSSDPSQVWRYDYNSNDDTDWANKTVYNLGYYHSGYNVQGFTWWADDNDDKYIWCGIHEGSSPATIDVYKWNGSGFDNYAQYSQISDADGNTATQGICRDFSGSNTYLYFATRSGSLGRPILKGEVTKVQSESSHSDIWVKLPSDGSDTIYLFAGNSGASEYSDGNATFPDLFDDFTGTSLNTSKWDKTGSGSVSVSNSEVQIDISSYSTSIYSKNTFGTNTAIRCRWKASSTTLDYPGFGYGNKGSSTPNIISDSGQAKGITIGKIHGANNYLQGRQTNNNGTNKPETGNLCSTQNTYHTYDIIRKSSSANFIVDDGSPSSLTTYYPTEDLYIGIGGATHSESGDSIADWIFVHKYASTPPTWDTYGTWTAVGGGNNPPTFSGNQPTGTGISLTPTANVTINDADGDATTVDWYNSTDNSTWTHFDHFTNHQANTSNSTTCSFATSYDTTYYIKVTANDGTDNSTKYWSFTTIADTTPPSPNPMTWATQPYAEDTSSISMIATTATDDSTPIYYYFHETTGHAGGDDSGWLSIHSYSDSGLSENTQYGYEVKAKDSASTPNEGSYSTIAYAYTKVADPLDSEFTIDSYGSTWINVSVAQPPNPTAGSTGAYFDCVTGGATDSGWVTTSSGGRYYHNFTGLASSTTYGFKVKLRNGDAIETALNPTEKQQTTALSNTAPTISNPSPANGSIGQELNPDLSFLLNDTDDDWMNITVRSNASGRLQREADTIILTR